MSKKMKQWTKEEIELLQSIKTRYKQKKWKLISKNFAKKGLKRTQHECRHKWVNCLDPQINHGPWTEEQLKTLYTQYEKNHSQWSIIQKFLPNRTQIKIKNHFYGVLRNLTRCVLKYFKQSVGRESEISNKINPKQLQSIYNGEKQYSFLGGHIKKIISTMNYKFQKRKLMKLIQQNEGKLFKLNNELLRLSKRKEIQVLEQKIQLQNIKKQELSDGSQIVLPLQNTKNVSSLGNNSRHSEQTLQIELLNPRNNQNEYFYPQYKGPQNYFNNQSVLIQTEPILFIPFFSSTHEANNNLNMYSLFWK